MSSTLSPSARCVLSPLPVNTSTPSRPIIINSISGIDIASSKDIHIDIHGHNHARPCGPPQAGHSPRNPGKMERTPKAPQPPQLLLFPLEVPEVGCTKRHTSMAGAQRPRKQTKLEELVSSVREPYEYSPGEIENESDGEGRVEDMGTDAEFGNRCRVDGTTHAQNVRACARGAPIHTSLSPSSSQETDVEEAELVGVNESQDTILTEPDDVLPPPMPLPPFTFSHTPVRRLTKLEAREKAQALKLRLRLASYRVFTNQITTPWSDLQVRTMPLNKLTTPSSPIHVSSTTTSSPTGMSRNIDPSLEAHVASSPPAPLSRSLILHQADVTTVSTQALSTRPNSPVMEAEVPSISSAFKERNSESSVQQGRGRENEEVEGTSVLGTDIWVETESEAEAKERERDSALKRSLATDGLLSLKRMQES